MKKLFASFQTVAFTVAFIVSALPFTAEAYSYSYVPKVSAPVVYNFLYRRREKCENGKKEEYPDKKFGACVSCRENFVYMIDDIAGKASCFRCPEGTLIAKKDGYPMCLSRYPVANGVAVKPDGKKPSERETALIARRLGANYKTLLPPPPKEETFQNKTKLKNVCQTGYPDNPEADRQIATCRKLALTNDFLCPYVEKNAAGEWMCRACPKNAPFRKPDGGCFTCPYGEEMVSLESGETVCASLAPKPEKKKAYFGREEHKKSGSVKTKKRTPPVKKQRKKAR